LSLHAAVGGVAFAALSRLQDDPIRLKSYFLKGFTLVNSITMPITFFCVLFAGDIVLVVLGPAWTDAAIIFRLLAPTVLVLGIINPTSWLLLSIGLQIRSLRIALVIAPLMISAYLVGLPYGPNGIALAYSVAMTLWLVPHVVWCLHNTPISAWELFVATWRPLLASILAAAMAFGAQLFLDELRPSVQRLFVGGFVLVGCYLGILLFIMGRKTFYINIIKGLKNAS
jgi:PST family polysaccharide transporter